MGEQQVSIHPGLSIGGKQGRFQLARRQHHGLVRIIEPIPIDIHVVKLVVSPDLLHLTVSVHQRLPVPQPDVVNRDFVGRQRLCGEALFRRERVDRYLMKVIGELRRGDVALDVWAFQLQFVGFDVHALDNRRNYFRQQKGTSK